MMLLHKQSRFAAVAWSISILWCAGCDDAPDAKKEPAQSPPGAEAKSAPSKPSDPGASSYDEEAFKLSIASAGPFEVGKEAFVQVVLEPKAPFKCNAEYPYKFQLESSDGLKAGAELMKRDAMEVAPERTQFKLAVNPTSAGEHTVTGTFSFSVCTDENCLVERKKLALQVSAK